MPQIKFFKIFFPFALGFLLCLNLPIVNAVKCRPGSDNAAIKKQAKAAERGEAGPAQEEGKLAGQAAGKIDPSAASRAELLAKIMAVLAERVDNFEHALPDFVTEETLTQEDYEGEKMLERTVTISRLTGRQLRENRDGHAELNFRETREVLSVNGKPSRTGEFRSRGAQVGGAFSSILISHFAARDQLNYYFDLDTEPTISTIRGRQTYLITFLTRVDHNDQYYLFEDKRYQSQQRGRAWIDMETLIPLRIEYQEINLPKGIQSISYSVDFSPVQLGEGNFMLPIEARSEIEEKKVVSRVHHEYHDYKKFSTDVKLNQE